MQFLIVFLFSLFSFASALLADGSHRSQVSRRATEPASAEEEVRPLRSKRFAAADDSQDEAYGESEHEVFEDVELVIVEQQRDPSTDEVTRSVWHELDVPLLRNVAARDDGQRLRLNSALDRVTWIGLLEDTIDDEGVDGDSFVQCSVYDGDNVTASFLICPGSTLYFLDETYPPLDGVNGFECVQWENTGKTELRAQCPQFGLKIENGAAGPSWSELMKKMAFLWAIVPLLYIL